MTTMTPVAYIAPLEAGWERMKGLLFRPFDLGRWMVIGFTAWLASLGEGGGSPNFNFGDSPKGAHGAGHFLHAHMGIILVVGAVILAVAFAIGIVLTWINARGRFMFLDNAMTGQARVAEPWRVWKRQGNSLFVWMVVFGFLVLGAVLATIGLGLLFAWPDMHRRAFGGMALLGILTGGSLLVAVILVSVCIGVYLGDFVVPLMRKHDLKTNAAWHLFLRLFRARPGPFILYLLLKFVFGLVVGLAVLMAGLVTCCCGLILIAIPYIGTVILLPLVAWERYWSLEFLRQFGPEYDLWAGAAPAPVPVPAPVPAPPSPPPPPPAG